MDRCREYRIEFVVWDKVSFSGEGQGEQLNLGNVKVNLGKERKEKRRRGLGNEDCIYML